jgi:16S rRNA G966 N2-methylase RsmD
VGIEALSRGAARAVFVESERAAVTVIQDNLRHTGLAERARVVRSDVFIYLRNDPPAGFDYIHIAPPQYAGLWSRTLTALDARPRWLNPDGVAVAQIHPVEFAELELQHLTLVDQRKYGSTLLCFFERPGE